jgi:hypothetical protein
MPMLKDPSRKYNAFPQVDLPDRRWPSRTITKAPRWLSTDLRDGNQAIVDPMDAVKKNRFFDLLLEIGGKEIEIGFPSAGQTEFDFISSLVRSDRVPRDVLVQVLTQSRADLIKRSFESLEGAHSAIVHLYNALSPAWREIVFRMSRDEVRQIAVDGAKLLRYGLALRIQPGDLLDRGARFQPGGLRGGDGGARSHARAAGDPQPARHGRGGDAQHLCRPDRVFLPQPAQSAERSDFAPHA